MSYLVPYDDIINNVYHGRAIRTRSPVPSMATDSDESHWPYDVPADQALAQAKSLLAQASSPSGFSFTLSFDVGHGEFEQMATLIQNSLAKASIMVTLDPQPTAAFQEKKYQAAMPAFLDALLPWIPDAGYFIGLLWQSGSIGALQQLRQPAGGCVEHPG